MRQTMENLYEIIQNDGVKLSENSKMTTKRKTTSVEEKFMRLAIEKAKEGAKKGQTPFGACIVKGNKVISCAHNAVWQTTDITAHAEISAIRQACRKLNSVWLKGCVIYSTCEPCPMCFSAIHWARISKIYYGAGIEDAKELGFNELAIPIKRMKIVGKSPVKIQERRLLGEENLELFKHWSALGSKKVY